MINFLIFFLLLVYIMCGNLAIKRNWGQIKEIIEAPEEIDDKAIFNIRMLFTIYWPFVIISLIIIKILEWKECGDSMSKGAG